MIRILGITGSKGSGKSTLANMIADKYGLSVAVRPLAKHLKDICIDLLGLAYEQVYGTEEEKNTPTRYLYSDFFPHSKINTYLTGRQVMQFLGTEVFRKIRPTIHAEALLRWVDKSPYKLVIVDDVRFPDETAALKAEPYNGMVVDLLRGGSTDTHSSEISRKDIKSDLILDNRNLTPDQTLALFELQAVAAWGDSWPLPTTAKWPG